MSKRKLLFIRDVVFFTLSAFGGPQAHLALMLKEFVQKRNYLTEVELMEINALCQLLPGPSSTQMLVAIAYRIGGWQIAILALLIWVFPAMLIMACAAIFMSMLEMRGEAVHYLRFITPVAVGFVGYSAITLSKKIINEDYMLSFVVFGVVGTVLFPSAYLFPFALLLGGLISAYLFRKRDFTGNVVPFQLNWRKVLFPVMILAIVGVIGALINRSSLISLPVRLFGNFYRNGFLVFGGGQVLVPLMYAEFVEMKKYLASEEFLSAWALQQIIPGPVFSFTSFVGGMSMRAYGVFGQLAGSVIAVIGINTPGFILTILVMPIWEKLKRLRHFKHALPGVNAISVGFVGAAFLLMLQTISINLETSTIILLTIVSLQYSKIPPVLVMLLGICAGLLF